MSLIYTWKLTGLKKTSGNDLQDVIVQTYWTVTGTDEEGNFGVFSGATPFDINSIDPQTYTQYQHLTQETVLTWIKDVVNGNSGYWDHIVQQINKQIKAKLNAVQEVSENDFPWATPTE